MWFFTRLRWLQAIEKKNLRTSFEVLPRIDADKTDWTLGDFSTS